MNKHICSWCTGEAHKMFNIHGSDSQECCYCNSSLSIEEKDETCFSILKYINDFTNDDHIPDCCKVNIDNIKEEIIRLTKEQE